MHSVAPGVRPLGRRIALLLLWFGLVAVVASPWLGATASASAALEPPAWAEIVAADSTQVAAAIRTQTLDAMWSTLDEHVGRARDEGAEKPLYRLLSLLGRARVVSGRLLDALPILEESRALALAHGDTLAAMGALRQLAYAQGALGRLDEQESLAESLLELAIAHRDARNVAIAHNFLGWNAMQRDALDHAREHLEAAVHAHREAGNAVDEAIALSGLGGLLLRIGDLDAAEASFTRQLALAREHETPWLEGQAHDGLGVREQARGDWSAAALHFERAVELQRAHGAPVDLAMALAKLARMELAQLRWRRALTLAEEGVDLCERAGLTQVLADCLDAEAEAHFGAGRLKQAEAGWRRILAREDATGTVIRVRAVLGLARVLALTDRNAESIALLARERRAIGEGAGPESEAYLDLALARRLAATADDVGALEIAARAISTAARIGIDRIVTEAEVVRAEVLARRGDPEAAGAAYARATTVYDRLRQRTSDLQWREAWAESGASIGTRYAVFLLEDLRESDERERVERAYGVASHFKARTLEERMRGPRIAENGEGPYDADTIGLAEIQSVLGEGEVLLEWFSSSHATLLFVITAKSTRVQRLDVHDTLRDAVATARDVFLDPSVEPRVVRAVAEGLRRRVFGDAFDGGRSPSRVILAPDGALHAVPFALLLEDPSVRESPLTNIVVSGASLVHDRTTAAPTSTAASVLAYVGPQADGSELPGARAEVEWLQRRLDHVTVRGEGGLPLQLGALDGFELLHFAAHATIDDEFPWRSAIGTRGDPLLAQDIADAALAPSLVVLASCSTAFGRSLPGDGVAGLSSAFLAAGARTVVASLWPVDDGATLALMQSFYKGLAAGNDVGTALVEAQRGLRDAHPGIAVADWAGFVVIGDPAWRPALARRPPIGPDRLVLLLLSGLAIVGLWRQHGVRDSSAPVIPS